MSVPQLTPLQYALLSSMAEANTTHMITTDAVMLTRYFMSDKLEAMLELLCYGLIYATDESEIAVNKAEEMYDEGDKVRGFHLRLTKAGRAILESRGVH